MAHTLAYLETNGVRLTAGSNNLTLSVYQMNIGHTYDIIETAVAITSGNYYDIEYSEDGVYKIVVTESEVIYTYADVNTSNCSAILAQLIKDPLYTTEYTLEELKDLFALFALSLRYFAQWTYTPAAVTDFTDATVISDLARMRNAVERVAKYANNAEIEVS